MSVVMVPSACQDSHPLSFSYGHHGTSATCFSTAEAERSTAEGRRGEALLGGITTHLQGPAVPSGFPEPGAQ